MAILNNSNAISSGGYDINNSLRFRSSASAYLNRTPASAGNRQKFTISFWIKRGTISTAQRLINCVPGSTDSTYFTVLFQSNNQLSVGLWNDSLTTTQVFRDTSAWYHIVIAVDATQATAANREIIYINGVQCSSYASAYYIAQNTDLAYNSANQHLIGQQSSTNYFDGYITEFNSIDGQALTPSSFGETDTTTGVWKPKAYTGTYGTNGFYLKFSDIATTSGSNAGLGKDFSGNTNYWTTNNISVTAGTTYDAMTDSPTLTSATVANYAVMNPVGIIKTTSASLATFAGANLNVSGGAAWFYAYSSIAIPIGSGKYYAEFTINTSGGSDYIAVGINPVVGSFGATAHSSSEGGVWYSNNATKWLGSTNSSYGASYTANDIIGVAVDSGASTITFYKNNTSQGAISFNSNLTSNTLALLGVDMYSSSISANFGQRPFSYTPPTGFVRLNTYNLPDSTIKKGNTVMDAYIYTGDGNSTRTITLPIVADFVWSKNRTTANDHVLIDTVRGGTSPVKALFSNLTVAEITTIAGWGGYGYPDSLSGTSYAVVKGTQATSYTNKLNDSYVNWIWQAGQGSTSSNTSGARTSTVSVNATAGFSVVTWTGSGSGSTTIGHGLGVAPAMIIIKDRVNAFAWNVYHRSLGNTAGINLNSTGASDTNIGWWNNTSPTSTLFTVGTYENSASNYVAYCWAEIAGFSRFTSYVGNGNADGPFVYCGFRPKYVMYKDTANASTNWEVVDSARNTTNPEFTRLFPNQSNADDNGVNPVMDFTANGFKIRTSAFGANNNGNTHIVMAFAENPTKYALAR
jgi:hypothetical protein